MLVPQIAHLRLLIHRQGRLKLRTPCKTPARRDFVEGKLALRLRGELLVRVDADFVHVANVRRRDREKEEVGRVRTQSWPPFCHAVWKVVCQSTVGFDGALAKELTVRRVHSRRTSTLGLSTLECLQGWLS